MKIIDVCAFYTPHGGGVKTYIDRKLRIGADHGHEVVVIAPGKTDGVEERPDGGRIIHVASPPLPFDRRYRYFAGAAEVHRLLDAERPDFVEASSPWRTASIVAEWRGEAPRALIMHADPLAAFPYRWFGGIASRPTIDRQFLWFWNHLQRSSMHFDLVVCANESFSERLREGGIQRVRTIPMGIDPGIFAPARRDPAIHRDLLARCALGEEASLLLGVGRHSAEKRWPMIIDACQRASLDRPIGLVLVGGGRDQPKIVRHIGRNPHVHLLAPIADREMLATVMASADALIHGCEAETFGLVAAEAAASGLPLIVPDEGGAADFARPGISETFVPGDVQSAAEAIRRLLDRDREPMRRQAERVARGARTLDQHFEELFHTYQASQFARRRAA
jgi:alpha-1,6-mannosyltransferase